VRKKGKKKKPFNDNSLSKLEMGIWKKTTTEEAEAQEEEEDDDDDDEVLL